MTLSAARMRSLPEFFQDIDDPRRRQGRRHALPTVLALATAATRSLLIRVDPAQLDAALRSWHEAHGSGDSALAIDGKTIRGAIDDEGCQTHVLSIVGVPPIYSIHRRNLGILHHHRIPFRACIRSSKSSRTARRSTQKSLPCDSR